MAIGIENMDNVDPAASPDSYGALRDNPGDNTGTQVNKKMHHDIWVFFQQMMALASVTPNGTFDNDTNGYQLRTAFEARIASLIAANTSVLNVNGGTKLNKTIVDIGDWDMDATDSISVAHGIADFTKIRAISALIRNDASLGNLILPLNTYITSTGTIDGGVSSFGATNVLLGRKTGGHFDSANYDQTTYNRGWIVIEHID